MWLSKQNVNIQGSSAVDVGTVTIPGNSLGVYTDMEQRGVPLYSPGGYFWRPKLGQDLLVIKCGDGGTCAAGTKNAGAPSALASGEVYIRSDGGTSIWLKNSGDIILSGNITVQGNMNVKGSLMINGTPIV